MAGLVTGYEFAPDSELHNPAVSSRLQYPYLRVHPRRIRISAPSDKLHACSGWSLSDSWNSDYPSTLFPGSE